MFRRPFTPSPVNLPPTTCNQSPLPDKRMCVCVCVQVLRDTLAVHEAVMRSSSPSSLWKYRALGCSIQSLLPQSPDYQTVTQLLQQKDQHRCVCVCVCV